MSFHDAVNRIRSWLKPGLTSLLGLVLLLKPDSVTAVLGSIIGFVIALVGILLLLAFFRFRSKNGLWLARAVILTVLGSAILKYPLFLASRLGQFIGLMLAFHGLRALSGDQSIASIIIGIVGLVLIFAPLKASRLLSAVCGLIVLVIGIVMLVQELRNQNVRPAKPDIIDVE